MPVKPNAVCGSVNIGWKKEHKYGNRQFGSADLKSRQEKSDTDYKFKGSACINDR